MWTVGRRRELRVRTIREEKERDEVAAAELRCRIIPTTKNIYGRRFLCSRLQSGICAAAAIFSGKPPRRAAGAVGGSRPLYFWPPPPPPSRVSPSDQVGK